MDLVFPAEHGLLTAGGLPVAESDTQLAHTRPEPFRIDAVLPRWLADGMSVVAQVETLTDQEWRRTTGRALTPQMQNFCKICEIGLPSQNQPSTIQTANSA